MALTHISQVEPIKTLGDGARIGLKADKLQAALTEALEALAEVEGFLDNQSDCEIDSEGYHPNRAMQLLGEVQAAIAKGERALERAA